MTVPVAHALIRVDRGVIEVDVRRSLRSRNERREVGTGVAPDAALAQVFATSKLLRAGRAARTRVIIETSQVVYVAKPRGIGAHSGAAVLSDELGEGLVRAIACRRIRGPATLELGPLARVDEVRTSFGDLRAGGVGVVIDRSNAAVTVLVIGESGVLWARSVPSEDACLAVRLLINRAFGMLHITQRARWWRLHDVASHADPRAMLRDASEFAAATASELDGVPLATQVLA